MAIKLRNRIAIRAVVRVMKGFSLFFVIRVFWLDIIISAVTQAVSRIKKALIRSIFVDIGPKVLCGMGMRVRENRDINIIKIGKADQVFLGLKNWVSKSIDEDIKIKVSICLGLQLKLCLCRRIVLRQLEQLVLQPLRRPRMSG